MVQLLLHALPALPWAILLPTHADLPLQKGFDPSPEIEALLDQAPAVRFVVVDDHSTFLWSA